MRVDITILDNCGNMVDAAMLAAPTAMRAVRRPDVSVQGEEVTIVCSLFLSLPSLLILVSPSLLASFLSMLSRRT